MVFALRRKAADQFAAPRPTLIIMARAPRMGRVKTRLAAGVGAAAALHFHRWQINHITARLHGPRRWRGQIAVTPDISRHRPIWSPGYQILPQGQGDLGERMRRLLLTAPSGPALLIGTDIPGLRPAQIAAGFRLLGRNKFVFGPAGDGGFWAVGVRHPRFAAALFHDIDWSRPDTLTAAREGLDPDDIGYLDEMHDVDEASDLARLAPLVGRRIISP